MSFRYNPLSGEFDIVSKENILDGTTQGQMAFWDATLGKWVYTETSELVFDYINKYLGLGLVSPQYPLHVYRSVGGGSVVSMFEQFNNLGIYFGFKNTVNEWGLGVNSSGDFIIRDTTGGSIDVVQIGATAPLRSIMVRSTGFIGFGSASDYRNKFEVYDSALNTLFSIRDSNGYGMFGSGDFAESRFEIAGEDDTSAYSALNITNASRDSLLFVRNDGYIGIGTNTPQAKLHTTGGRIKSTETSTGTDTVSNEIEIHFCNSATAYTLNLPTNVNGKVVTIINKGAGVITLSPTSGSIGGETTQLMNQNDVYVIHGDGTDWY